MFEGAQGSLLDAIATMGRIIHFVTNIPLRAA
jgi:hypothetical protein